MDRRAQIRLRIGDWCIDPGIGQMSRNGETVRVEARTLRLLLCLADRPGEVLSIDELLGQVWAGVVVAPDSVYQGVALLRRLLGDDSKQPKYIATVPRLGYRMVAPVSPWVEELVVAAAGDAQSAAPVTVEGPRRGRLWWAVVAAVAVAVAAAFLLNSNLSSRVPARSVAVLAFLDLTTQAMDEEYFADGMTEAIIDRLSKVPGVKVPSATSSFYFKGKRATVAEIARSLGATYVLDGSVRKSAATLRIAARLARAADGYVVWTQTYDRPAGDQLWVQENIADEVAKALSGALSR